MIQQEVGRVVVGRVYRMYLDRMVRHGDVRVREEMAFGTYKVLGFAFDYPSYQEKVLYQGLEGGDQGELFVCSLMDFALKFRPEPVIEPSPSPSP